LPTLIRPAEFARLKGLTRQSVLEAMRVRIAAAIVERDGKRLLNRDLALDLWDRNTQRNNNAVVGTAVPVERSAPATPRPAAPPASPPSGAVTDEQLRAFIQGLPEDAIPDLNESRARREHYSAEKARLEALQGRGELIPAADVKKEAFALARAIRDALMTIPDRLAPELAACTDARQVHQLLSDEIRVALRGLSNG
jgi:hypothetical protein